MTLITKPREILKKSLILKTSEAKKFRKNMNIVVEN